MSQASKGIKPFVFKLEMNTFVSNLRRQFYHIKLGRVKAFRANLQKYNKNKYLKFFVKMRFLLYNLFIGAKCSNQRIPTVSVIGNKMAKKQYFAILDTETTIADTVADFAIVICDRDGKIYNQCAVLLKNHFDAFDLFYDKNAKGLWSFDYAQSKKAKYNEMLNSGSRMLASVSAVNNWVNQAIGKYNPILTAYNLAFDKSKCANTGILLDGFSENFCLWQAAVGNVCNTKKFKQFCLENHAFNAPTANGNMTFKTNAEIVCGFITGDFKDEPHTALEDARDFELPILREILKKRNWKQKVTPYNWREFQTRDHFQAK